MPSIESTPGRDAIVAEKSDAVCRMGAMMLTSGTGSYRVKAAMGRTAEALGIDQLDAQVSLNEIVATTRSGKRFRTQVVEVAAPSVNADRISSLLRVSLGARAGVTAADLHRQLDEVEQHRPLYSLPMVAIGAAAACGAFAFLNNGRWQECAAAAVAAGGGKIVQVLLHRQRLNHLAVVAVAAAAAGLIYLVLAQLMLALPFEVHIHQAAFTSAMLFLVPGFPLVTAALDLARFDFTSGVSRLLYATLITLAAAVGVWIVAVIYGLSPGEIPPLNLPLPMLAALWLGAGFVGVLGFAVTFNTPLKMALSAAGIGALANTGRLVATDAGVNALVATVLATTVVGLLAAWASQRLPAPRIILSVPAVLIMIPGAAAYRALVAGIDRDPLTAVTNGSVALGILVAMAIGLVLARMLTDPAWTSPTPRWTHMPSTHAQRLIVQAAEATDPDSARSD
ncbi:MAG TPA: threonine/serine exporter family protein [Propionicimonas sp.]|nr:threonine/serine exporter family protein [Propionicimonas sp.]